ncbi:DUF6236 family protein [Klebsiella aerogenes]|nr:hypothetical protein [Klebsiella aerogenes]
MKNKIIMQHGLSILENGGMQFNSGKIKNLNTKVLYWDGIMNIKGGFAVMSDTPDILTLKREGIYEDYRLKINKSGDLSKVIIEETKSKIIELLSNKQTNYLTDGISPEILIKAGVAEVEGGALFCLSNALPAIDESLPIEEVLEFREKRGDLHRALINHINSLEMRVLTSEFPGQELKKAIHEIDTGCAESISLYKERGIKFNLSNIKVNFNMKEIIAVSGSVYGGASLIMPQTGAAISGFAAGLASVFSWNDAIKINTIKLNHPFNYIAEIQQAGFM